MATTARSLCTSNRKPSSRQSLHLHQTAHVVERYRQDERLRSRFLGILMPIQVDTGGEDDESEDSDSESDHTLDVSKITEMRLVPSDPNQLDALFEVFNECAELNPEPAKGQEEEEEHNWVFSADQSGLDEVDSDWDSSQTSFSTIGHPNGNSGLARDVLELHINDQRFEDAEETESNTTNGGH